MYFDSHFKKNVVTLYPGEFFATADDSQYISTVLGSCIAITLFDARTKIGGMNHFMLARDNRGHADAQAGRFGEYAIELLLNDMLKRGAKKQHLTAKVFGGGNIFDSTEDAVVQVGSENIAFAFDYLERESIPVKSSNVGGNLPRKIFFDPKTSRVWLKFIQKRLAAEKRRNKKPETSCGSKKEVTFCLFHLLWNQG